MGALFKTTVPGGGARPISREPYGRRASFLCARCSCFLQAEQAAATRAHRAQLRDAQEQQLSLVLQAAPHRGRVYLDGDGGGGEGGGEQGAPRRRPRKDAYALNRSSRWLALMALVGASHALHGALQLGRARAAARARDNEAARALQRQWRARLARTRIAALVRSLRALRRGVWWWRLRKRIDAKRAAVEAQINFLAHAKRFERGARIHRRVRLFLLQVRAFTPPPPPHTLSRSAF